MRHFKMPRGRLARATSGAVIGITLALSAIGPFVVMANGQPLRTINQSKQEAEASPLSKEADRPSSDEWIRFLVGSLVSVAVGFGAAYIGAQATRSAAEKATKATLVSQEKARLNQAKLEQERARIALLREIAFNLSLLTSDNELFRRLRLQRHALGRYLECVASMSEDLQRKAMDVDLFIERYNALVSLMTDGPSQLSSQVMNELKRYSNEGEEKFQALRLCCDDSVGSGKAPSR